ncbi:MAG: hypothetical protein ACKVS8_10760 [Phycisphaerales bacterium]
MPPVPVVVVPARGSEGVVAGGVRENPLVRAAAELFHARVVDAAEGEADGTSAPRQADTDSLAKPRESVARTADGTSAPPTSGPP